MYPRQQTAGTMGILGGIAVIILFALFFALGTTPEILGDPAKALPLISQKAGLMRALGIVGAATVALPLIFVAGLAAKLREKAPTRAIATLYFGVIGFAGYSIVTMMYWVTAPAVAAYAAKDQVAASHAWVAINALLPIGDNIGSLFLGLSTLVAGWAIVGTGALSSALGWFGVLAGILGILFVFLPGAQWVLLASGLTFIIWLLWAGNALRTAM